MLKKKCEDCVVGSGSKSYCAFGGESFIGESAITNKKFLEYVSHWENLSLFPYCPYCGNKNNLEILAKTLKNPITDYMLYVDEEEE